FRGHPASGTGLPLSRPASSSQAEMDLGGRGRLGKQPARQVLPAHRQGPPAARRRDQQVGQAGARHRLYPEARARGGQAMRGRRYLENLDEEIRDHIAAETADNIASGMTPVEARQAALRKFGNVLRVQEDTREVWSVIWIEQWLQDIRYGLRML